MRAACKVAFGPNSLSSPATRIECARVFVGVLAENAARKYGLRSVPPDRRDSG